MACNDVNWSFFQTCSQVIMSDLFPSKQGIESNQRSEQGQINVAISVGWCLTSKSCALDLTPSHYNKIPVFFQGHHHVTNPPLLDYQRSGTTARLASWAVSVPFPGLMILVARPDLVGKVLLKPPKPLGRWEKSQFPVVILCRQSRCPRFCCWLFCGVVWNFGVATLKKVV